MKQLDLRFWLLLMLWQPCKIKSLRRVGRRGIVGLEHEFPISLTGLLAHHKLATNEGNIDQDILGDALHTHFPINKKTMYRKERERTQKKPKKNNNPETKRFP